MIHCNLNSQLLKKYSAASIDTQAKPFSSQQDSFTGSEREVRLGEVQAATEELSKWHELRSACDEQAIPSYDHVAVQRSLSRFNHIHGGEDP
jgi:hypothetical protein